MRKAGLKSRMMKDVEENHEALLKRNKQIRGFGYDPNSSAIFVARKFRVPSNGKVLEVGTGNGRFTVVLARRTEKLISCDLDLAAMRRARLNLRWYGLEKRVSMVRADAARLPFRDGLFDAVISVNTLHHIGAPMRAVREMARVLKPGGTLVIADFSEAGFRAMDRLHHSEGRRHVRSRFSMEGIRLFLRKSGLNVHRYTGRKQDMCAAYPPRG